MKFVTMVGTQIMAVLNPLMACGRYLNVPLDVILFETATSAPLASRIESWLGSIDSLPSYLTISSVQRIRIFTEDRRDQDFGAPWSRLHTVIDGEETLCFNLAGGLGAMISSSLRLPDYEKCLFLYPEYRGVQLFSVRAGGVNRALLPLPEAVDILALQQIPVASRHVQYPLLDTALRSLAIHLSDNVRRNLMIGGVPFALVWNAGNYLHCLAVLDQTSVRNNARRRTDEANLAARFLISLARSRKGFGELFDRRIAVLTGSPVIAERIEREGGGKIQVFLWRPQTDPVVADRVSAFLGGDSAEYDARSPLPAMESYGVHPTPAQKTALYTILSPNPMTSLLALWSHRPSAVVFFYTAGDPLCERCKTAMVAHRALLPTAVVSFLPIGFSGDEILETTPAPEAALIVNITPGAKPQKFFLRLWGLLHGAEVCSLDTPNQQVRADLGPLGPISGPLPTQFLLLGGGHHHVARTSLIRQSDLGTGWRALLYAFLTGLRGQPLLWQRFPQERITLNGVCFEPQPDGVSAHLTMGGKSATIPLEHNRWFEEIVGYALLKCGADAVEVGVRTFRAERPGRGRELLSDLDVAARFKGRYVIVECKSGSNAPLQAVAAEAVARARAFDRFALPIVAFYRYLAPQPPVTLPEATAPVIDGETLCDPSALGGMIEQAFVALATTNRRR